MRSVRVTTTLTASQRIGRLIRDLRKQRKLTGGELAQMVGASQSRISKIENGYSDSIDVAQVETLLGVLKPSKIIRQQILMLSFQLTGSTSARFTYPFTDIPEVLNDLQQTTALFRCYIISGVSAVLQTVAYRTAYLQKLGLPDSEIQIELSRTLERQEALWNPAKTFYLVMPEAALYTAPGTVQVQIAQLDRLERVMGAQNIHVGIIPTQAGVSVFETGTFTFYDDKLLYLFMGDRVVKVEDTDVLLKYLNAFEDFCHIASFDAEAIEFIRKAEDYFSGIA